MDQGFPGRVTTSTSVTVGTTTVNPKIRYDPSYIFTLPGILKALQVVLSLIGFICVVLTPYDINAGGRWFNFVAGFGFWVSAILLSFYIFHIIEKFHKIPWIKIEFIYCSTLTLFNLIAAIVIASLAVASAALGAAAFFGFSTMVTYGADAWLKYLAYKRGDIAQGERQADKTVSTTTSPAY